jgi:cyclopropane fatty-acyl-phospholipid synthase-like methyltransferase
MPDESVGKFRGYPVMTRRFELAGRTFELLGPANFESLIDDPRVAARFEQDEYMPYWAEFWPASLLLAETVAAWGRVSAGADDPLCVLELGCGLGLVSLVALHLDCRVIASDYDEDALAFLAESAHRNGLPIPETRYVDWRESHPDLHPDRIVAAEVLYETRNLRPIAQFVERHLKPSGIALICDANRSTADDFDTVARHCGLIVETTTAQRPNPADGKPIRGRIFQLRRQP